MTGIIFDQPELWKPRSVAIVLAAAQVVTAALQVDKFSDVFGEQHVRFNNGNDFFEYSTGDTMVFHRNRVYLQLVIHALGHTFDRRANLRPQIELAAGRFNLRHALLFPGMHPPSMDGGNEPKERWANTWEAFCCQTFAPNIFGVALEKFMTENMARWCALAMGVSNVTV